jgi:orotidine-5'-phosphate decarboxylase
MNRILAALDVPTTREAVSMADRIRTHVAGLKIGSQLFTAEGPSLVRDLVERGDRIFLDLKYHDIPNTVAEAVRSAAFLGVWMVNVHASGGTKMMKAAREAADQAADTRGSRPIVIAVTVLTSFDEDGFRAIGVNRPIAAQVEALAAMAQDAGLDGVVASPHEIAVIRARCGSQFQIVTPGIRAGAVSPGDDQARTMTGAEAVSAGATYVVVGRPILRAANPAAAAAQIAEDIASDEQRASSNERRATSDE